MAEEKASKDLRTDKLADPVSATIDAASQLMIQRAHELGVETVFDRAVTMKPCNIGTQGTCCKNCAMGPGRADCRFRNRGSRAKTTVKAFAVQPPIPSRHAILSA